MVKTNNAITLNMGLCEGRHEIPQVTDGYIFPSEVNPIDLRQLNNIAVDRLMDICEKEYNDKKQIIGQLNLYVTGLTVALIEVLNICKMYGIRVTLYHYNRDTNDYFPQEVVM